MFVYFDCRKVSLFENEVKKEWSSEIDKLVCSLHDHIHSSPTLQSLKYFDTAINRTLALPEQHVKVIIPLNPEMPRNGLTITDIPFSSIKLLLNT